jgi:cardiolipin synthase
MILGFDSRKHKIFMLKSGKDAQNIADITGNDFEGLRYRLAGCSFGEAMASSEEMRFRNLARLNYESGKGALTCGNVCSLLFDGESKFGGMLADIAAAKSYAHLLYYIVRDDELGRRVIGALAVKAREGCEVRLLVDGMGCINTPKSLFKPLIKAGGDVAVFLPRHFARINYRNHRKICVVDGKIGYVGGLNIGDEYLGRDKRFGFWRDCHIRLVGDAVKELEIRFILDWNFSSRNPVRADKKYFPETAAAGGCLTQIVCSGPDTRWPAILQAYSRMIAEAERNIYIQSPYFVPSDIVFESLITAALSGVDVRLMFPSFPDHPFVYWANMSFLGLLLEAGVKCYKYEKGFVHSKMIVIDSN